MTWPDITGRTRQTGAIVLALQVEGIEELFTSHPTATFDTTGMPANLVQVQGMLSWKGIKWGSEIDPKRGDIRMPSITFTLVDGPRVDSAGSPEVVTQYRVSDILGRGTEGVTITTLRTSCAAGNPVSFDVDSTAGFVNGDKLWIDQECMTINVTDADTFATTARGLFGSEDVQHIYDASDDALRPEGHIIPEASSAPISWYGRRVDLWVAQLEEDGGTSTPTRVYRGQVRGSYKLSGDGSSWEIPTEPLWTIIDTNILVEQPISSITGWNFDGNLSIDWNITGGTNGTVTLGIDGRDPRAPPYADRVEFMEALQDCLNDNANGLGQVGVNNPIEVHWHLNTYITILLQRVADNEVTLTFHSAPLQWIFNSYPNYQTHSIQPSDYEFVRPLTGADVLLFISGSREPFDTRIVSSASFTAFNVEPVGPPPAMVASIVLLGDIACVLHEVDPGATSNTLRLQVIFTDFAAEHAWERVAGVGAIVFTSRMDSSPVAVREGVLLEGDFLFAWQTFIENATIPAGFKGYARSGDFDWTGMRNALSGGGMLAVRKHAITEPESLRKRIIADLAWAGLYPTLSGGMISARSWLQPNAVTSQLTIDEDILLAGSVPGFVRSRERVINQLTFRGGFSWLNQDYLSDDLIVYNDRTSQQRYALVEQREIENRGIEGFSSAFADELYGVAYTFFNAFAHDYPIVSLDCTIAAALLEPGDTITVTETMALPDPATGGRGITNELMLVMKVLVKPGKSMVEIEAIWNTGGARHSGYAPAADVTAYTLVPPDELTIAAGVYATDQNEGLYFAVGDKILLQAWDDISPIADEAFTITSINATGTTIGIDAAPSANMQTEIVNGNCRMVYDEYDTGNQTAGAQLYVHVCDDADNLIGASGDDGFKAG